MRSNRPEGAPNSNEVLEAIRNHFNDWNQAPTITELTQRLNCGRGTVQRAIALLESDGWLIRRPQTVRGLKIGRIR
jgi:DNA-binding GntR family transcriptional regulator